MGRIFSHSIRPGDPINKKGIADGLAKIDHALTFMRVEGGIIDWGRGYPVIKPGNPPAQDGSNPFWTLSIDGDKEEATCNRCWLWVSGSTFQEDILTCALDQSSGYLQIKFVGGNTPLELDYTSVIPQDDPPAVFRPLYQIKYELVDEVPTWQVVEDLRAMPQMGVYL